MSYNFDRFLKPRKRINPDTPEGQAKLRALFPDYDEHVAQAQLSYGELRRLDDKFQQRFPLPPLHEGKRAVTMRQRTPVDGLAWADSRGDTLLSGSHDGVVRLWQDDWSRAVGIVGETEEAASERRLRMEHVSVHEGGIYDLSLTQGFLCTVGSASAKTARRTGAGDGAGDSENMAPAPAGGAAGGDSPRAGTRSTKLMKKPSVLDRLFGRRNESQDAQGDAVDDAPAKHSIASRTTVSSRSPQRVACLYRYDSESQQLQELVSLVHTGARSGDAAFGAKSLLRLQDGSSVRAPSAPVMRVKLIAQSRSGASVAAGGGVSGLRVATGDGHGVVRLFDAARADAAILSHPAHFGPVLGLDVVDTNTLLTCGKDGLVGLLDLRKPDFPVGEWWTRPSVVANCAGLRTDSRLHRACGGEAVNDVAVVRASGRSNGDDGFDLSTAPHLEFGDARSFLAAGHDGSLRQYDMRQVGASGARPTMEFLGHCGAVRSVAVSGDAQRVATCCADGSVRVWRMEWEGKMLGGGGGDGDGSLELDAGRDASGMARGFGTDGVPVQAARACWAPHTSIVSRGVFHGKTLASGGWDCQIKVVRDLCEW